MRALMLVACALACSSGPPPDATIKVSCACVLPDGGASYAYEFGNAVLCATQEAAQRLCPSLLAQVPPDAGRPSDDCIAVRSTCQCVVGVDVVDDCSD